MTNANNRKTHWCKLLAVLSLCGFAVACQQPVDPGPKGKSVAIAEPEARLELAISELPRAPHRDRFRSADGRYTEESALWVSAAVDRPSAGLRLSEATSPPPLSDPGDPAGIIAEWRILQDKRPAVSNPEYTENLYGRARWWRVGLGTSVCVLFVQRLDRDPPATATLSGFFCNPPGLPMSPDAAATVVAQVRLRPAPNAP